ncbi:hypothetical protein A3H65_03900 [Candidatus Giovannonibacteria bacterium RIFCSPLOWO2_02_FULL_45_14]|uniref:Phosphoglycerate mutase n=1 Tax=Candidatus Giovannonibacteria bacterium RIFCSPLOWO2_12_FULL_44_15 TaxID=1798364 RepID=A0A1F5Y0R7_9BACT|nr:MAG: hypothetical protein A3C75_00505 [Candidatus Giovannonibacteria bacterium RIFCSPHIGHO2_02_FULL_44_31]OGF76293.1 MAG: hypothetical protein A3E62_03350 [Candidatus Giovannonibacteria bacterium RIFCSPHIGHO2_12_FULL_44_29]OGF91330.1 MAG: hypothetical protein A3H65_03900 [Candidatus Giovannonibacteria bacterium RIFCSPLOWO2_02_FULL_45_14]OGF93680.1 MAG: hypothetical protein A3G54_00910 [Candidatus Giovannonibacteria bacterium RIFCSPLOWO2_12_FULL_44_15]
MKFILVRHCETDWNREWRLQGHTDTNLSERGWIEADELAQKLKPLGIKKIVSSDLKRSRETASAVKKYVNVPIIYDPRLRECNFGSLEGKRRSEVSATYIPSSFDMEGLWHGSYFNYDFTQYGGESRDTVLRRHLSLLDELLKNDSPEPTLLIGHGTGLNTLLSHLKKSRIQRGEYAEIEYN